MNLFWQELIKLLGGFVVVVGALAWLTKSITTHLLDKDVEKYKSRLQTEAEREIERFKSQLQMVAKEHEVRFSNLHEKRAEIISDLYELMYEADISVGAFELRIKDEYDEATLELAGKIAHDRCLAALKFFRKHRLYLSQELSDLMHRILSTMEITSGAYPYSGAIRSNALDHWKEQSDQIGLIMARLEREFRLMLGSETENPH
jgi:5-hydroxyisourate hydrolase-like protein (transthyretin family)